jgi:hypothetical protein
MKLIERIAVLEQLGNYLLEGGLALDEAIDEAYYQNGWFTPEFIRLSIRNIATAFLPASTLQEVAERYQIPENILHPKNIGLVMAGNIPLVGFHDFLCIFLSGHAQTVKLSSKDSVLLRHLAGFLHNLHPGFEKFLNYADTLKGCDAYIATGSGNTARYFHQYFSRYPHIIRKNRTGIAILDGTENSNELDALADDIQLYFGLGCRNITQIHVPTGYDFTALLEVLRKYDHFMDYHKYKHNYDYLLTISMMNREAYLTNGSIVLRPHPSPFAGIASLHYGFYNEINEVIDQLNPDEIQVIAGHGFKPFGQAQCPIFFDYADGIDTMAFLQTLN